MGINNIARFFRGSIEYQHTLPRNYNLAIDSTLLLIPLLKTSHTVTEFIECFERYFATQTELRNVIVSASEIFIGLDYYYPAMKQDTCRRRLRDIRRQQQQQQQGVVVATTNISRSRYLFASPLAYSSSTSPPTTPSASMHLKQVRELIEPLFLRLLDRWHSEQPTPQSPTPPTTVFDVQGYGEGEIKCFKHQNWRNKQLPTVVLSNDNDVLLLILMHGAMNRRSLRTKFYRIATTVMNSNGSSEYERCVLQNLSLRRLLRADNSDCIGGTRQMQTHEQNAWMLVVWLIACYGSDYVYAIRAENEATMRKWLSTAMIFLRDLAHRHQTVPLNPHNFFFVINLLFDAIAATEDGNRQLFCMYHYPPELCEPIQESTDPITWSVYCWCVRVYWNILYLHELPIDFTAGFSLDPHVSVNLYVTKQFVSEITVRSLNQYQRQQLHNMFCIHSNNLQRYEQISPARPVSG